MVTELDPAPVAEVEIGKRLSTEERILEAAEQCMSRLGLQRASMSDVAAQAGLSRGSVYMHFGDRASLVDAVLARVATRFVASSETAVRRRRTLAGQVGEAAVFIRQHLGDRLLTLQLPADDESLIATLMTAQIHRLVVEWVEFWKPFLADAERRGEVRPGLDYGQAGEWIVRLMISLAVMPAVTFDADDPEATRAFVRAHLVRGPAS
jgi:AcrR family transcriptional regulator